MYCAENNNLWPQTVVNSGVEGNKSKALTTGGTEDHGGNQLLINVDLFDALH